MDSISVLDPTAAAAGSSPIPAWFCQHYAHAREVALPAGDSPIVLDDFLFDPNAVRRHAMSREFIDWKAPDGEVYKRIWIGEVPGLRQRLECEFGPVDMLGMGYRLNFGGELPNAAIHSDLGWGTHALVLFLTDGNGGTAFWRHRETGATRIEGGDADLLARVQDDWNRPDRWEQISLSEMAFNRAVVYESALFHSRYPFAAFGNGPEDGRLIAVAFFNLEAR